MLWFRYLVDGGYLVVMLYMSLLLREVVICSYICIQ